MKDETNGNNQILEKKLDEALLKQKVLPSKENQASNNDTIQKQQPTVLSTLVPNNKSTNTFDTPNSADKTLGDKFVNALVVDKQAKLLQAAKEPEVLFKPFSEVINSYNPIRKITPLLQQPKPIINKLTASKKQFNILDYTGNGKQNNGFLNKVVLKNLERVADIAPETVNLFVSLGARLAYAPNWRLSSLVPTGGDVAGIGLHVLGFLESFAYQSGITGHYNKFLEEHKTNPIVGLLPKNTWNKETADKLDLATKTAIEIGKEEPLHRALDFVDKHVFIPLDNSFLGNGADNRANFIADAADKNKDMLLAKDAIHSKFSLDPQKGQKSDNSLWEIVKWGAENIRQFTPMIVQMLVTGQVLNNIVEGAAAINDAKIVEGSSTQFKAMSDVISNGIKENKSLGELYNEMNKVVKDAGSLKSVLEFKSRVLHGGVIQKLGGSLVQTDTWSHMIATETAQDLTHKLADKFGGKEWKKFLNGYLSNVQQQDKLSGKSSDEINFDMKYAELAAVKKYFDTNDKLKQTQYKQIVNATNNAYYDSRRMVDAIGFADWLQEDIIIDGIRKFKNSGLSEVDMLYKKFGIENQLKSKLMETGKVLGSSTLQGAKMMIVYPFAQSNAEADALNKPVSSYQDAKDVLHGKNVGAGIIGFVTTALTGGMFLFNPRSKMHYEGNRIFDEEQKDRNNTYTHYRTVGDNFKTNTSEKTVEQQRLLAISNDVLDKVTKLHTKIQEAVKNRENPEILTDNQIIHVAFAAYSNGTINKLLEKYNNTKENAKNPEDKQHAQTIINRIHELKSMYEIASDYKNPEKVFSLLANDDALIKLHNNLEVNINNTKQIVTDKLDALAKTYDINYHLTDNSLVIDNPDNPNIKKFKDALNKDNDIITYLKNIGEFKDVDNKITKGREEFTKVTSDKYQQNLSNLEYAHKHFVDNYFDYMSIEKTNDFKKTITSLANNSGINDDGMRKAFIDNAMEEYNKYTIAKQNAESKIAEQTKTINKKIENDNSSLNTIINHPIIKTIKDKLKTKSYNEDETMSASESFDAAKPILTDDESNVAKQIVKQQLEVFKNTDNKTIHLPLEQYIKQTSFVDFINNILSDIKNSNLSEDEKTKQIQDIKDNYSVLAYGWKANGYKDFNEAQTFQDLFVGKSKTDFLMQTLKSFSDKKNTTKVEEAIEKKQVETNKKTAEESIFVDNKAEEKENLPTDIQVDAIHFIHRIKAKAEQIFQDLATPLGVVNKSDVRAYRIFNPNEFNHGDKLTVKVLDNDATHKMRIHTGLGTSIKMHFNDIVKFFTNKFRAKTSNNIRGYTKAKVRTIDNQIITTFSETGLDGKERNYKLFDQREQRNMQQGLITDFFVVTKANDFNYLNSPDRSFIKLHEVRVTKNGKSYIIIEALANGQTHGTKRVIQIENEVANNKPIAIVDADGEKVGWLTSPSNVIIKAYNDYNNKGTQVDRAAIRLQQLAISRLRDKIVNNNVTQVTVSQKLGTKYAIYKNGRQKNIDIADPNTQMGVIADGTVKLGSETFENKKRIIENNKELGEGKYKNGSVIELRKIGTNKKGQEVYKAFLSNYNAEPINKKFKSTIITALKAFLTQKSISNTFSTIMLDNLRKIVADNIKKETNYDVLTSKGLRDFLSHFMMVTIPTELEGVTNKEDINVQKFIQYKNNLPANTPILLIKGDQLLFGISHRKVFSYDNNNKQISTEVLSIKLSNDKNLKYKMTALINAITYTMSNDDGINLRRGFNSNSYKTNKSIPLLNDNGSISSVSKYQDIVKKNTTTNIAGFAFTNSKGDAFHTTVTNTTLFIDSESGKTITVQDDSKPVNPTKDVESGIETTLHDTKPISTVNEDVKDELNKVENHSDDIQFTDVINKVKHALTLLGSENTDIILRELNQANEDEDLLIGNGKTSLRLKLQNEIPGISPGNEKQLIIYIANEIIKDSKGLTLEQINTRIKKAYDNYILPTKEQFVETIDLLKNLRKSDSKYSILDTSIDELQLKLSIYNNLKASWKIIQDKVSSTIYKYLGFNTNETERLITEQDAAKDKIYSRENIEFNDKESISREIKRFLFGIRDLDYSTEPKKGFLGTTKYMPFDEVYNTLLSIVGKYSKANMSYDEIITALKQHGEQHPFLLDVVNKLVAIKKIDNGFINRFMVSMSKHRMSMKYILFGSNSKKGYSLRVLDTNTSNIENILINEWNNNFNISNIADRTSDGIVIDKKSAEQAYNLFKNIEDKLGNKAVTISDIDKALKSIGIFVSIHTLRDIQHGVIRDMTGKLIKLAGMFTITKNTRGLGSIARQLHAIATSDGNYNITDNREFHPFFYAHSILKIIANNEAKYTTRGVIAFRSGDKNIAGYIQEKFATDRIENLKNSSKLLEQLKADPFSTNSMLVNLLLSDNSGEIKDLLYIDHLDINALKLKGKRVYQDNNNITKLVDGDIQTVRLGVFTDMNQGKLNNTFNNIPLRMARVFFPTMSDKSQALLLYMPVLDLSDKHLMSIDNKTMFSSDVQDVLFSQLVLPELQRILSNHKDLNIEGYEKGSQIFMMIHELNNLKINNVRLIKLLNEQPDIYNKQWVDNNIKEIREKALSIVSDVLNREIDTKKRQWLKQGNIDEKGNYIVDKDYFKTNNNEVRFEDRKSRNVIADFVVNQFVGLSNIFQTVAGDIAQYSVDKAFKDFGINRSLISDIPELKNIFSYSDVMRKLKELYLTKELTKDKYESLINTIEPLPFEPVDNAAYSKMMETVGVNLGKRLALLLAPGDKPHGEHLKDYRELFLNDDIQVASNIKFLINLFYGKDELSKYETMVQKAGFNTDEYKEYVTKNYSKIGDFFAINAADAQEFTTGKETLDLLYGFGKITEKQYNEYTAKLESQYKNGVNKDNELTDDNLRLIFQPMKPVYSGSIFNNDRMRMMYIKSSSFPLLPQLTAGGELEPLRIAMEKLQRNNKSDIGNLNVRAAYKSAVKVGATITGIDLNNITDEELLKSSAILDRKNFKIQQDLPVHALFAKEDTGLIGTQLMKLAFGDGITEETFNVDGKKVKGSTLLNQYNSLFGDLINELKKGFNEQLGLDNQGNIINSEKTIAKMSEFFKREANNRNFPQQDINHLDIIPATDNNGNIIGYKMRTALWMSPNVIKFESLVNSMVTKKLVKLRLPGYGYIVGTENAVKVSKDATIIEKNRSRIIFTDVWNDKGLHAYLGEKENQKAQIMIPSRLRDLNGDLIDLFEGNGDNRKYIHKENSNWKLNDNAITDKLLNTLSYRIPTSSLAFATSTEIAGILPPELGDLMLVPKEFAILKGLDYDVDKEFTYHFWSIADNNKVTSVDDYFKDTDIDNYLTIAQKKLRVLETAFNYRENLSEADDIEKYMKDNSDKLAYIIRNTDISKPEAIDVSNITKEQIIKQKAIVKLAKKLKQKIIENKLISTYHTILSSDNPNVQKRVNKVLSMDFAKGQKELLQSTDHNFTSILSDRYQTSKMKLGATGQSSIGVYANALSANAMFQQLGEIDLGERIVFGDYVHNGKLGRYIPILSTKTNELIKNDITNNSELSANQKTEYITKLDNGKLTMFELQDLLKNSKNKKILENIRSTSDVLDERINTATDNEKEQIMGNVGINNNTIGVDAINGILGFDKGNDITDKNSSKHESSLAYFLLSQPIIKEYVEMINNNSSNTSNKYISGEDVIKYLENKYHGKVTTTDARLLTAQNMYDNINGQIDSDVQIAALAKYLQFKDIAKKLKPAIDIIGITKKGLDKSFFNTLNWIKTLGELHESAKTIKGIEAIIGDIQVPESLEQQRELALKGYTQIKQYYIKPETFIGHLFVNSVKTGYEIGNHILPYDNQVFQDLLSIIKTNTTLKDNIETNNKIVTNIRKYLNTLTSNDIVSNPFEERQRLMLETKDKLSLAHYLMNLKNNKDKLFENPFIKNLIFKVNDDNTGMVTYDNSTDNDFDEDYIYNGFMQLYTNPQSLPDNLAAKDKGYEIMNSSFVDVNSNYDEILKFKRKVVTAESNKNMQVGETKVLFVKGQRFLVKYLGNKSVDEYGKDAYLINKGNIYTTNDREFVEGKSKHLFSIDSYYNTVDLGNDLAEYSLLSGGTYNSVDFSKYIPTQVLEQSGYYNTFRNLSESKLEDLLGKIDIFDSPLIIQYLQHNSEDVHRLRYNQVKGYIKGKTETLDAIAVKKVLLAKYTALEELPMAVTIGTKNSHELFILTSPTQYTKVPIVGKYGLSEYDATRVIANTILDNKKTAIYPTISKPVDREHQANIDYYDMQKGDINETIKKISKDSSLGDIAKVADELLAYTINNNINVNVADGGDKLGSYSTRTNQLMLNIAKANTNKTQAITILHEFIHKLSVGIITEYFDNNGNLKIKQVPDYINRLKTIFDLAKEKLNITDSEITDLKVKIANANDLTDYTERDKIVYSLFNPKEFVSKTRTDKDFRNELNKHSIDKKSILSKVYDVIKDMLKKIFGKNPTLLDLADQISKEVISEQENVKATPIKELLNEVHKIHNQQERLVPYQKYQNKIIKIDENRIEFKQPNSDKVNIIENRNGLLYFSFKNIKDNKEYVYGTDMLNKSIIADFGSIDNYIKSRLGILAYNVLAHGEKKLELMPTVNPFSVDKITTFDNNTVIEKQEVKNLKGIFDERLSNANNLKVGAVLNIKKNNSTLDKYEYFMNVADNNDLQYGSIPYKATIDNKLSEMIDKGYKAHFVVSNIKLDERTVGGYVYITDPGLEKINKNVPPFESIRDNVNDLIGNKVKTNIKTCL